MAHVSQIPAHMRSIIRQDGRVVSTVYGSSGAEYSVTTDGNGVISCSCMAWRNIPLAIADRVCKHLAELLDVTQTTASSAKAKAPKYVSKIAKRPAPAPDTSTAQILNLLGLAGSGASQDEMDKIRDVLKGVKSPVKDLLDLVDKKAKKPPVRDADTSEQDMTNLLNQGLDNKPKKRQIELDD